MPKSRETKSAGKGTGIPRRRQRQAAAAFPALEPFARRLESLRLERGLTQRALALRAQISANHYQEVAYARANPTVLVLLRLAEALDVSVVDFFDPPSPLPGRRRSVAVADLEALVAIHRRLTSLVERLARDEVWDAPPDDPPEHDP